MSTQSEPESPETGFISPPTRLMESSFKSDLDAESQPSSEVKKEQPKLPQTGLSPETGSVYIEQASKAEEEFIKRWTQEMDTLLLFATLFSAVITAFVIESYHSLQPDSGDDTVQLLQQILVTLQSNHTYDELKSQSTIGQPFTPHPSAVRVNALWFASLVISISTAFLAILGKQWLFRVGKALAPAQEIRVRQYQFTRDATQDWRLPHILSFLPILLHISLLLFFAGLIEFLWPINSTVAIVTTSLVATTVFVYVFTHVASLVWPTCPYRTTFNVVVLSGLNSLLQEFFLDLCVVFDLLTYPLVEIFTYLVFGVVKGRRSFYTRLVRERRYLTNIWSMSISMFLTPQYWENRYIFRHSEELDARALTRMIGEFPQTEETNQLLGQELTRSNVVKNRGNLLFPGTVWLLAGQIRSNYVVKYRELTPDAQDKVLRLSSTLARLLTEAEEDDPRTLAFVDGVPIHYDVLVKDQVSPILIGTGICAADAVLTDTDDLLFFSNMLRLQLYASSTDWFEKDISQSVDKFQERLESIDDWTHLPDEKLLLLVNAAIHVATREDDEDAGDDEQDRDGEGEDSRKDEDAGDGQKEGDGEHEAGDLAANQSAPETIVMKGIGKRQARTLNVLATLMSKRPDLSLPIQRQICWGVWMCSNQAVYSFWGPLITNLKTVGRLSTSLATLMRFKSSNLHVPHTLLVLLEALLYSAAQSSDIRPVEQEDKAQLVRVLVARYPVFLDKLCARVPQYLESLHRTAHISPLEGQTMFIRLLKRIVSISGYLAFYASGDVLNHNPVQIGSRTIDLLLDLGKHVGDIPESDRQDFWRIAYGTAAQMTILQSRNESGTNENTHDETGHDEQKVSRDGFAFDDFSPDMLADAIIAALRAASAAAEPPFALKLLLLMIMLLSSHVQGDTAIDNPHSTILSRLRDADVRAAELIAPTLDFEGYRDVATGALAAVQRNVEGVLSMV